MRPAKWPEPLRVESEEFLHLDLLRIFASLCVVLHHYKNDLALPASWRPLLDRLDMLQLSVDLFFIISGVVISGVYAHRLQSKAQLRKFLQRRLARLVPLHLITLAVMLILGYATPLRHYPLPGFTLKDLPANVLLLNCLPGTRLSFNIVTWSISAEIFCYLLYVLYVRMRVPTILLLLWPLCYCLLFALSHAYYGHVMNNALSRAIPAFGFGVALQTWRPRMPRLPGGGYLASLLAAIGIGAALCGINYSYIYPLVFLIAIVAQSADVHQQANWFTRSFAPLGQLTYSTYMWHIPLRLYLAVLPSLLLPAAQVNVIVGLTFVALFPLSYASLRWMENPTRRWISGWGGGRRTPLGKNARAAAVLAP